MVKPDDGEGREKRASVVIPTNPIHDDRPQMQRTRFGGPSRFSTVWHTVKAHLTPASHPSATSESGIESSFNRTDLLYAESVDPHSHSQTLDLLDPKAGQSSKHKRVRRKAPKSSIAASVSRFGDDEDISSSEPVSHIVVDADFDHFTPTQAKSESGSTNKTPGATSGAAQSNRLGSGTLFPREDAEEEDANAGEGYAPTDAGSIRRDRRANWVKRTVVYEWIVERAWPNIRHFLDSSFPEPSKERSFQKEAWFTQKQGALVSAAFILISWTLTVGLQSPFTTFTWYAYFGIAGFFSLPILPMVIFDFPRRYNRIWQPILFGAAWILPDILISEMFQCGFFSTDNRCGSRNFINLLGFSYGTPVLAIFALRQSRVYAAAGAIQWLVLVGALLMTQDNYPTLFYRNIVNFTLFHTFLVLGSFLKERSDRQMFALRQQLKIQATQAAQVMERRASDSKKRFVSYIFHEVRVPLNTALLAVQNLEGENVFRGLAEDQAEMVHGLMGSLTMMEKVLNDVLSFNRMESGKFAQAKKPFEFHKSIQLVALSHRMQAQMTGIDLLVDLDKDIDKIGGMFVGDEMRLRQVTSNLVSNSIKFTASGSVRIVTKLLYPRLEPTPATEIDDPLQQASANLARQQKLEAADRADRDGHDVTRDPGETGKGQRFMIGDVEKGSVHLEQIRLNRDGGAVENEAKEERNRFKAVVRVEIHDTGVGLKKQDVIDNRLFSPYVQTEIGRRQGGKGSGLGLALVRQIVKLSHGRLGVESQCGKGSMFWFELPYSLPSKQRRETPHQSPASAMAARFAEPVPLMRTLGDMEAQKPDEKDEKAGPVGRFERPHMPGRGAQLERPHIEMTESMVPLITHSVSRSEVPPEELIITTYPPIRGSAQSTPSSSPYSEITSPPDVTSPLEPGEARPGGGAIGDPFNRPGSDECSVSGWSSATKIDAAPATLPAAGSSSESRETRVTEPLPSPEGPLCTLVVDDDRLTRMLMSRMLTRLGHQVTTAENGKIALDMITASFLGAADSLRYDVVFLDNQMPLLSGVEVAREVRLMGCPLYIVGCTGNALREDQEEYIAAGADGIIPKPIHQKAVLEMIKEARRRVAGETVPKEVEREEDPGGHYRL